MTPARSGVELPEGTRYLFFPDDRLMVRRDGPLAVKGYDIGPFMGWEREWREPTKKETSVIDFHLGVNWKWLRNR